MCFSSGFDRTDTIEIERERERGGKKKKKKKSNFGNYLKFFQQLLYVCHDYMHH